jgi:hypothetical protein
MADKKVEPKRPGKDEPAAGARRAETRETAKRSRHVAKKSRNVAKKTRLAAKKTRLAAKKTGGA